MRLINIGFGNMVADGRTVAVVLPEAAPVKRMIADAREKGLLIDATCGRRTRAVLITDSDHIILCALTPESVALRAAGKDTAGEEAADETAAVEESV